MDDIVVFRNDGYEIAVDSTGECFYPGYNALARVCSIGLKKLIHQETIKRSVLSTLSSVTDARLIEAEVQTAQGLRTVTLIPRKIGTRVIKKYNEPLYEEMADAGHLVFLHKLAGYKVTSNAVKPASQSELILLLAQQNVEIEKRLNEQQAKIDYFSEKIEAQEKWLCGIDAEVERLNSSEGHYYTIVGFANLHNIQIGKELANNLGRKASSYCRKNGLRKEEISDSMFGKVGCYPIESLNFVFTTSGLIEQPEKIIHSSK